MQGVQFYPIDVRVRLVSQKPVFMLYGKTISGDRIVVIDNNYLPYFYVVPTEHDTAKLEEEIMKIRAKVDENMCSAVKIEKKQMKLSDKETSALKVYINNPFGISHICDEISKLSGISGVYEHDIPLLSSYLIDKRITPCALTSVEGEVTNSNQNLATMRADSLFQDDEEMIKPKVLAFDIEVYSPKEASSPDSDPVLMISFYSDNYKKTITWKEFQEKDDSIEFVKSEFEMLNSFKRIIEEFRPDFLVGYASDIYSFPYLKKRAEKYGIKLDIGVDRSIADITSTETSIKGIVNADIYKFISKIFASKLESETFRLEDVAQELLGEGKKKIDVNTLSYAWDNEPETLKQYCDYNLHDAHLTYRIFEKILPIIFEFVKFTGMDVFNVIRGGFHQFAESFLIKESKFFNEIVPSKQYRKEYESKSHGLFIEPEPGIYNNIVVYDFKSLYPSIIATHNISPGTLRCKCCDSAVPNENMHFCKKALGFIPRLTGNLIDRKERISNMLSTQEKSFDQINQLTARRDAISFILISLHNLFNLHYSRWYNSECANAVTAYGRFYVDYAIDKAKEAKFDVFYTDIDSIFIKLGNKNVEQASNFLDELNASLPEKIRLDYEGFYTKGIFVATKTKKETGRKYALLSENGFLKIKGLESTRRNFSTIAKETQEKVLYLVLKERKLKKALEHVQEVISDVKENKIPMKKMIIYTQLARELSSYETIAPHVAVAQRMQKQGFNVVPGSMIRYVVAKGEGTIAEMSQSPNEVKEYNADYYVEHQIIPSVEKIFEAAGIDFLKVLDEKEQSSLGEFI